ncbi:MAG: hypothetical protein K2X81_24550 [Candidatus Obscuribacterales bacterium]|nr:hypothetical protein [Candidatus Obscuribacterales bacterium]
MPITDAERKNRAETYQRKSAESFLAAQDCLQKAHYRAVCNRCWYAVMQSITAGVYMHLNQYDWPPLQPGHLNWKHSSQSYLFKKLCSRFGKYTENRDLLPYIGCLLDWRESADYDSPDDNISAEQAAKAIHAAQLLLNAVEKLPCPRW